MSAGSLDGVWDGTGGVIIAEQEEIPEFELPHAGQRYVYAVNPERDSVAVIDATTLEIHSVDAGDEPKFLQTLAGRDQAIVLNVKSEDATVIRTSGGSSETSFVDVAPGSNAIAVAPDGKHAVVYLNSEYATGYQLDSQSVSVLTLEEGEDRSTNMSVGYRPSAVHFSDAGDRAFVVTEDGVSVLDFAAIDEHGPDAAPTVSVGQSVTSRTRDVSITRDGRYALARQEGQSVLRLVDLGTGEAEELDVALWVAATDATGSAGAASGPAPSASSQVTDVDLSPDNTFALAVVRPDNVALKIAIPGGFRDAEGVEVIRVDSGTVGSATLAPDGTLAILYTTAVNTEETVTLLDLETLELRPVALKKTVRAVAIAEDNRTALVVHNKLAGDPLQESDPDVRTDMSYGYSVIELGTTFSRLQLTPSDIKAFTILPEAEWLFVLFEQDWQVECMPLGSFVPEHVTLASRPVAMGVVPDSQRLFVGQQHPDGRITFIDWETLETTSVTGFELNSKIQEQ
jgi:hypothetical protein